MATRARRSDSLDFQPSRPDHFDEGTWELVCKTPCSDQLLVWVSSLLVDQNGTDICSLLSVHCQVPCESSTEGIYQRILFAWHENRKRKTFFSELISPLSRLAIPGLEVNEVKKRAEELYDQGCSFEDADDNDSPPPIHRNNSGSSSGSVKVFGELSHESAPVDCTEIVESSLPGTEEMRPSIYSQLVTGVRDFNLPVDESGQADVSFRELREEINRLQRRFASLLRLVYKMLDDSQTSFPDLRVFLTQRCIDEKGQIPQFSHIMLDILNKATAEEIFIHLSRAGAWNFLSYFLLNELLEEFDLHSDNQNLKTKLSSFKQEVDTFKQNTVLMDFLRVWGGRCDDEQVFPGYRSVIAKSIADPASFTIADACRLAGLLAGQFNLKDVALELSNGCRGSVYVAWRVPAAATRNMLEKMMDGTCRPDLLHCQQQYGIVELAIERKIFKLRPSYESIHKLSVSNPQVFWGGVGAKELKWRKRSKDVFHMDKETGEFHWFRGAQVNASENCLDVHVQTHPDKIALIWERDDEKTEQMTYKELLEATCRVANLLKKKGVKKGDVVIIYMPTMPLAVASMLACARIGAIHCVIFSDFNAKVLGQRLRQVKAKAIITTGVRVVGGECKSLKKKVVEALNSSTEGEHEVKFVLVARRQDDETGPLLKEECDGSGEGTDFYSMEKEMEAVPPQCDPEAMDGEATLFIAYTSGTQMGTSKAVYHTQAGYLLYTKLTFKFMFEPGPEDIMGCVSDLGWIAAHSYVVYGPLSNGMTTLLFESTATYPNNDRYWRMVEKLRLTHFYTVPSVLKELKHSEVAGSLDGHDLKSLKVIASGGEPMPLDIQQWYYSKIGKGNCLFLDTWGQTELGGTGILRWDAPERKMRASFPPSKSFALYGVDLHLPDIATTLNDQLKEQTSKLYLKQPLPSMGKYVLINGKGMAYEAEHYDREKGCYSTSDLIMVEKTTNLFRVTGRIDRAIFINKGVWLAIPEPESINKGVWLSIPELEDSLRASYAGTDVFDAQVVSYENKCQHQESNPRLCAVLRTSSSIDRNMKDYWAFYAISTMASLVSQKMASLVSQKLVEAGKKFEYIVYFLQMSTPETAQKCFQTVSGKTCTRALKNYIYVDQGSSYTEASKKPLDIDENDLLQFCKT